MHSQVYENKIKPIVYISLNGICKAVPLCNTKPISPTFPVPWICYF